MSVDLGDGGLRQVLLYTAQVLQVRLATGAVDFVLSYQNDSQGSRKGVKPGCADRLEGGQMFNVTPCSPKVPKHRGARMVTMIMLSTVITPFRACIIASPDVCLRQTRGSISA